MKHSLIVPECSCDSY